jgi:hypothetical protein
VLSWTLRIYVMPCVRLVEKNGVLIWLVLFNHHVLVVAPWERLLSKQRRLRRELTNHFSINSFQAISVIGGARIYFLLTKQRVNFLQKRLARRNNCTNFGDGKRDVQRVKITHVLSQSSIELRAVHSGYYSGVNCTSRSI